jgi:hypothetical protein
VSRFALLVLLLAGPAVAKEPAADPVKKLPQFLRPGTVATYDRAGDEERLAGTVVFRAESGPSDGTVRLLVDYDSGDRGVLTLRDRLAAVLDAKSKEILTFDYSVGGAREKPLVLASRLVREMDREGKPIVVHVRLTYPEKDKDPRVRRTRVTLPDAWAPDLLEPFLVPLLGVTAEKTKSVKLLNALTGRIGRVSAVYARLGEGKMLLGEDEVKCDILRRTRGEGKHMLYLRTADSLPLKAASANLTLRPAKEPDEEKEEK